MQISRETWERQVAASERFTRWKEGNPLKYWVRLLTGSAVFAVFSVAIFQTPRGILAEMVVFMGVIFGFAYVRRWYEREATKQPWFSAWKAAQKGENVR